MKDTGTQWQIAANLPFGRNAHIGVGLDNGKFLVSGQDSEFSMFFLTHHEFQVVILKMGKRML